MVSTLRCPHCNAPLTRVDGKDPTECPYCHTMLTAKPVVGQPAPGSGGAGAVIAVIGVGVLVVLLMGAGAAFFLLGAAPVPAPVPAVVVAVPAVVPAPAPPKPPEPPSPVKRVLQFGEAGTNPGQLESPTQLAVASDGSILVAERDGRLQRFAADGAYQATVVMEGDKLTKQNGIFGLTADASGNVYVNRVGDVLVYEAATFKPVRTLAGDYPDRYYHGGLSVDGAGKVFALTDRTGDVDLVETSPAGKVLSRHRVHARDVAVDGTGRVFLVGDDGVEVQDTKGGVLSKVGGVRGRSIAFDGKGHVFVATGSAVEVLSPEGTKVIDLPVSADEIALDRSGKLYALEGGRVAVYDVTLP